MNVRARKCYFFCKIFTCFLLALILLITLFDGWPSIIIFFIDIPTHSDDHYEAMLVLDEANIVPGLGINGARGYLTGDKKEEGDESLKKYAMNIPLSDSISYSRRIIDTRIPGCKSLMYDAELPSTSVVIIFYNEPFSALVRTVISVLETLKRDDPIYWKAKFTDSKGKQMGLGYPGQGYDSKYLYLKEIVLVDDGSTNAELQGKLEYYIRNKLPLGLITLIRNPTRQGVTKARLTGAYAARGDVLVFLDAHCEMSPDWLRPLLQRIKDKRKIIVSPVIDVIKANTFEYIPVEVQVGGFTWNLEYIWNKLPLRETQRRTSTMDPVFSPTMAGGLFAINRLYFWRMGSYDSLMDGWGGENIEMSFRIWMCGGAIEIIPCSRVGHVFRAFHPYPILQDTIGINMARVAEVWMDDYKEVFYLHNPGLKNNPAVGDLSQRKRFRDTLDCQPFQWYLDKVTPEKLVPIRDSLAYGRFKSFQEDICLVSHEDNRTLYMVKCGPQRTSPQVLTLTREGFIRDEEKCALVYYPFESGNTTGLNLEDEDWSEVKVDMVETCHLLHPGHAWTYLPSLQLQHASSGLCLDSVLGVGHEVLANKCSSVASQKWHLEFSEQIDIKAFNTQEDRERDAAFNRIRNGYNYSTERKGRKLLYYQMLRDGLR